MLRAIFSRNAICVLVILLTPAGFHNDYPLFLDAFVCLTGVINALIAQQLKHHLVVLAISFLQLLYCLGATASNDEIGYEEMRWDWAAAGSGEFKKLVYDSLFTKCIERVSFVNSHFALLSGLACNSASQAAKLSESCKPISWAKTADGCITTGRLRVSKPDALAELGKKQ